VSTGALGLVLLLESGGVFDSTREAFVQVATLKGSYPFLTVRHFSALLRGRY
jgi:hypothetical protein